MYDIQMVNSLAKGEFVGVFQIVAEGHSTGYRGDFHPCEGKLTIDVERCRLPFHICIESEDDLLYVVPRNPRHKCLDGEVVGADTVHRGNDSAQHVVEAVVLPCILYAEYIAKALHHAHCGPVAGIVTADGADAVVAYHIAVGAIPHSGAHIADSRGKPLDIGRGLVQQVQRVAERALAPHPRKRRYLVDGIFEQFGSIILLVHWLYMLWRPCGPFRAGG